MQNQTFLSYSSMIKEFNLAHARGAKLFVKLYRDPTSDLLHALSDRDWHRFYVYKKIIRYLERHHIRLGLGDWLCETDRGQHLLRGCCKKLAKMTDKQAWDWEKSLTATKHWG